MLNATPYNHIMDQAIALRPGASPPPSWVPSLAIPIGGGERVGTTTTTTKRRSHQGVIQGILIRQNCRKSLNSIPNAVNCREVCQGPNQCRHLKQKKAPLFRNVGEMWVETWAKRVRAWNPWWHGLVLDFCWRQGPEARKHCMETH